MDSRYAVIPGQPQAYLPMPPNRGIHVPAGVVLTDSVAQWPNKAIWAERRGPHGLAGGRYPARAVRRHSGGGGEARWGGYDITPVNRIRDPQ